MVTIGGNNRELWIRHACVAGASLWFKGNPPFSSDKRHMFFVLGTLGTDKIVLVNATSQVHKRLHNLDATLRMFGVAATDVTVRLPAGSHPFITKDTVIDCSRPFILTRHDLAAGEDFSLLSNPPSEEFFVPLLHAWAASPFAQPAYLEEIRGQWARRGIVF
ncbi:hypothetical protein HMPREF1219_01704 [Corynebacterium pyruviciproducens ATCC BAA-1742]|uniref:Uncharacterized protein n=1 Tax=Corynebacterium pyruviciproducens ATCC BAA-1742 TaxID=1125779 RepID=S2YVY2_9CORY|nr:hypothetical protein [Corynebacterium pyruviciproducens]EPD68523.1 hypothetical protein HMPREF1219_01704 [Corynebacterium pyruviciproducens ATCC BAA-1742]